MATGTKGEKPPLPPKKGTRSSILTASEEKAAIKKAEQAKLKKDKK